MSTEESVKRVANGREQAENTLKSITELADTIEASVRAFEQIVASTNQQRVGLEQVSEALQQIRTGSEQTAAGTKQIEQAVSEYQFARQPARPHHGKVRGVSALRQKLLDVFEIEYREHLEAIRQMLASADGAGGGAAEVNLTEATRRAHSLKGAARAVGLERGGDARASTGIGVHRAWRRARARSIATCSRFILDALDDIEDRWSPVPWRRRRRRPARECSAAEARCHGGAASQGAPRRRRAEAGSGGAAAARPAAETSIGCGSTPRISTSSAEIGRRAARRHAAAEPRSRRRSAASAGSVAALENSWNRSWKQIEVSARRRRRSRQRCSASWPTASGSRPS